MFGMRRREFVTLLGGAAAAWPLAARAQQPVRLPRIGVLMGTAADDPEGQKRLTALRDGLDEVGWSPGRNIEIYDRWHNGDIAKARVLAKELVDLNPDLLVANTTPSLAAIRLVTRAIPTVFVGVADPVAQGFAQSLARPGGNITGFGLEEPSMGAKWVELLKEIAPHVTPITVMFNPDSAPYGPMFLPSMKAVYRSPVELSLSPVHHESEIEEVITTAGRRRASGLIILPDAFLFRRRETIVALAGKQSLPAVYPYRPFVTSGGLVCYAIDRIDLFRRAASYVDRILKGAKPADLPVQQPTKFELVINLKTAKALGLEVPPTLLARADEVIE
jgi:putative ABC transport system substrate-binding protein